jgi:LacI family transcriptional regulator
MAVTLADVARLAGVSPATVSRVINDSAKKVNEDLRDRVLAAVRQLHYVPNAHAQNVARPRKSAVGVIVHDVSDPYFAEITRGLQRQAGAHRSAHDAHAQHQQARLELRRLLRDRFPDDSP